MRTMRLLAVMLFVQLFCAAQQTTPYIAHYTEPFSGPQVYKDSNSKTLFYVETDGRHVAAISDERKLLWCSDPHKDADVEPYRTDKPQIVYIGPAPKWYNATGVVAISFNNSQFGVLKISNGDFEFLGQD